MTKQNQKCSWFGIDWFTVVGPMSFTFSQPLTQSDSDIEETFRFNIGTTF